MWLHLRRVIVKMRLKSVVIWVRNMFLRRLLRFRWRHPARFTSLIHLLPPPVRPLLPAAIRCHPQLVWGPWPQNSDNLTVEAWESLAASAPVDSRSPALEGRGKWGEGEEGAGGTVFRGWCGVTGAGPMFVVAVATVDQSWASRESKTSPDVGPQVGGRGVTNGYLRYHGFVFSCNARISRGGYFRGFVWTSTLVSGYSNSRGSFSWAWGRSSAVRSGHGMLLPV